MKNKKTGKTATVFMSWFVYVLIFFEMIYMATPFAFFFYAVYGIPLKALNANQHTFWLIQPIFPHFSQTKDLLLNLLFIIAFPLMGIGFVIFLIGFIQIYWAKFTRKSAVLSGIYKYIRHPQYVGWSLFGFGMAMIWSRMIVWLVYVTMLFIYYLLAKSEENECRDKFGESYEQYRNQTGMFFPKIFKRQKLNVGKDQLGKNVPKIGVTLVLYCVFILLTAGFGSFLRNYTINKLSTYSENNYTVLSTTVTESAKMKLLIGTVLNNEQVQEKINGAIDLDKDKMVIYILPRSWNVSELGINLDEPHQRHNGPHFLRNPSAHGNITDRQEEIKKIIISAAVTTEDAYGLDILKQCRRQIPKLIVHINAKTNKIDQIINPPAEGKYKDIPVPMY